MRNDGGAGSVNPLVAVGVVEVPVGVDEVGDRIRADCVERFGQVRLGGGVAGVDEQLAVFSGKDRDVAADSHELAHIAAEVLALDRSSGSGGAPSRENIGDLLGLERRATEAGGCDCPNGSGDEAAARERRLVMRVVLCMVEDTWRS